MRTARTEDPRLVAQLIEVEADVPAAVLADVLRADAARPADVRVRHRAGIRQVPAFTEILSHGDVPSPFVDEGVYLITGGAGGLGLLFAEHMATTVSGVTLVLTGRSELSGQRRAQLERIRDLGAEVAYEAVDVADSAAVAALVARIVASHGRLDGVIHAAGILRDALIVNKSIEDFSAVLAAKVTGLVNLDEATKDSPWPSSPRSHRPQACSETRGRRTTQRPTPSWTRTPRTASGW